MQEKSSFRAFLRNKYLASLISTGFIGLIFGSDPRIQLSSSTLIPLISSRPAEPGEKTAAHAQAVTLEYPG
jgi:hypothetical protein